MRKGLSQVARVVTEVASEQMISTKRYSDGLRIPKGKCAKPRGVGVNLLNCKTFAI